jgi:GNAT superfamily N-acetyltransferase
MATTIRPATAADVPQILAFIRALAVYERAPDAVIATEEGLLRDGFGPHPFYECLIADYDGRPAGFALYFFNYSTWVGRPGIYLEDLFVQPELRGHGIGKALLQRVAAVAVDKGCQRMQWAVLDWNTPAIDFYAAMGAEFLDEWRNVRVSGEALQRLAGPSGQPDTPGTAGSINKEFSAKESRAPSFPLFSAERVGDPESQARIREEETAS